MNQPEQDFQEYEKYPVHLNTEEILVQALLFAEHIKAKRADLVRVLTRYETHEVANDEIDRSLDLLINLHENAEYFQRQVGPLTSFLPRNQPLYAFCCFVLVPSLMTSEAHYKVPEDMNKLWSPLMEVLKVEKFFPNIFRSEGTRNKFVQERSRTVCSQKTDKLTPVNDVVIFTGTAQNAGEIRKKFHHDVLFIMNGAGHNPIVIAPDADLEKAVASTIRVKLYNQGQDCASPNSILVHKKVAKHFTRLLEKEVKKVKVGPYSDPEVRVGPLSNPGSLVAIQECLSIYSTSILHTTPGIINTKKGILEPTIIVNYLEELGGNYRELFAPVFFVYSYNDDVSLATYFDDENYHHNAMYVTIFGQSDFIDSLPQHKFAGGRILHPEETIIRNTDLHAPGVERGTKPYGGYGSGASYLAMGRSVVAKPTLPQRDIFEQLVKPRIFPG